jgi:CHAT domain-containing protein/tetratricopeptide (TPR) repeat protein
VQTPKNTGVLVLLVLWLPNVGGSNPHGPSDAKVLVTSQFSENSKLAAMRVSAAALFHAGRYVDAAHAYRHGYEQAIGQGESRSALRFLNSIGAAWLAALQYRDAARAFLEARQLARSQRDLEMDGVVSLNLASVYLQMGEWNGARDEARRALGALEQVPGSRYRAQALIQSAKLRTRSGDFAGALPEYLAAIRAADAQGDVALEALAANLLGFEYLRQGRLDRAERAILEAFRLRLLQRKGDLAQSYHALAMLRLAQGDTRAAEVLLERAVEATERDPGRVPNWAAYHARGELRAREHRLPEALCDFRTALELARAWRLELLPSDAMRTSAEVTLDELYSSFIRTAGELYFETGRVSLAREAFVAAEEIRAVSLRATLAQGAGWRDRLPAAYGRTLAELRSIRTALLREDSAAARERVRLLQGELAEMEMQAGLETTAGGRLEEAPQLVEDIARALDKREAFLSFHLDEPHSYAWVVTRDRFAAFRLAGAAEIRAAARDFSASVQQGKTDETGSRLYALLFRAAGRAAESKERWLLAVEDVLFGTPFPALTAARDSAGAPVFLVERHAVTIAPGALVLRRAPAREGRGGFVGIGDPIYNAADERRGRRTGAASPLQLPRLAASSEEIRECARLWRAAEAPVLLEGGGATRRALAGALAGAPGVIHFATHVIRSAENPARRLIPLSLLANGDPEYIGPEDIAAWRLAVPALVVISGCASGAPERRLPEFSPAVYEPAGKAASELGLVGLPRAWLAAGARAVAVTLWPTPDNKGEFFQSFYRHLERAGGASPAVALERAQVEMLHSRSWRSVPKHWAAYLIVGRG